MAQIYDPADRLTPRQLEIVRLSYTRYSADEIAVALGIAPNTVRWHATQIRRVYPHFRYGADRTLTRSRTALTQMERRIARLVAEGLNNRTISHLLSITTGTVSQHLNTIYRKTGAENRLQLALTTLIAENRILIGAAPPATLIFMSEVA